MNRSLGELLMGDLAFNVAPALCACALVWGLRRKHDPFTWGRGVLIFFAAWVAGTVLYVVSLIALGLIGIQYPDETPPDLALRYGALLVTAYLILQRSAPKSAGSARDNAAALGAQADAE